MSNLLTTESITAKDVFVPNGLDPFIKEIELAISDFKPDLSTVKGRKEIASMAAKVSSSKTFIEKYGKDYSGLLKEESKKVDAERKRFRDWCDAKRDEVRAPLTKWEEEEKARIQAIEDRIQSIRLMPEQMAGNGSDVIASAIEGLNKTDPKNDGFENLAIDAAKAKNRSLELLAEMLANALDAEAKEKQRIEEEDRLAKEREELEKQKAELAEREAEQRAKEKAEADAQAKIEAAELAAKQAEEAQKLAEERAKQEAELAAKLEREKIEEEKRQAELETKRREEDEKHRRKFNDEALKALVAGGFTEEQGKQFIRMVASKEIPHISINY